MIKASKRIGITILSMIAYAPVAYATHLAFVQTITDKVLRPIANVMFLLATLLFMVGVVEYIAGADNEKSRTDGRNHMLWGVIGLIIMMSVRFILSVLSSIFYSS